jgi:hypothetical protein
MTPGAGSPRDMAGPDRDAHVRVFLRPVGTPVALGLGASLLGTTMLSGLQLGWVGGADEQRVVAFVALSPRSRSSCSPRCSRSSPATRWRPPASGSSRALGDVEADAADRPAGRHQRSPWTAASASS